MNTRILTQELTMGDSTPNFGHELRLSVAAELSNRGSLLLPLSRPLLNIPFGYQRRWSPSPPRDQGSRHSRHLNLRRQSRWSIQVILWKTVAVRGLRGGLTLNESLDVLLSTASVHGISSLGCDIRADAKSVYERVFPSVFLMPFSSVSD